MHLKTQSTELMKNRDIFCGFENSDSDLRWGPEHVSFFFIKVPPDDFVAWINFGIISYWQHSKSDSLVLQSTKSAQNVCAY